MKLSFALLACATIFLSACGGGGSSSGSAPPPPPPAEPPPPPPPPAFALSYVYDFGTDTQPNGPLFQAGDGNFYATTRAGGAHSCSGGRFCGTIFRLTPGGAGGVFYSFGATASDGFTPNAPLIQGKDDALYGTTSSGGEFGKGTVFRITLAGEYSVLYSFGARPTDGVAPVAGLIQAGDGNFYGTTSSGGTNHCPQIPQPGGNCGTIFRLTPDGIVTFLHSFGASPSDGATPNGSLVQASDGNFYGTTLNGGANACSATGETNNCGTVFRITPAGAVTVLHSFGTSSADGSAPQGSLIQGLDGALYGTTASGGGGNCGNPFGCGTVFRVTTSGNLTILYRFATTANPRSDGYFPGPFLIQAADGNFYGITGSGGATSADMNGTAFRLTPSGSKTIIHSFGPSGSNPSHPVGGLIQAKDGSFYGLTFYSGANGAGGTIFRIAE